MVVPFSQRLKERSLAAEKVPGCVDVNSAASVGAPVGGQGNTPVTTTASAVAGRKLMVNPPCLPEISVERCSRMPGWPSHLGSTQHAE